MFFFPIWSKPSPIFATISFILLNFSICIKVRSLIGHFGGCAFSMTTTFGKIGFAGTRSATLLLGGGFDGFGYCYETAGPEVFMSIVFFNLKP